jgi:rhomboid protease GluP
MSLQPCATCGKEFDRHDDPNSSPNCPTCSLLREHAARAAQAQSQSQPGISQEAYLTQNFPVTMVLIGACVLVFLIMVFRGVSFIEPTPAQAIAYGADFGPLTLGGQWWRLVTSMFVHYGIIHIALNMWCLWSLGRAAEQLLGRFSYLLAYFVSGVFGSIASVYWHPQSAGAGASGAIFGLAGVLVAFVYLKKTPSHLQINKKMLGSLGSFIVYNLILGQAIPGISNAAHIGGCVMGLAVGAALPRADADEYARRSRLLFVTVACALVLVAAAITTQHLRAGTSEINSVQNLLHEGKFTEAAAQLEQLTARDPSFALAQSMLGSIYMQQGRYTQGTVALKKAYKADPSEPKYAQQLGAAYLNTGQFDDAVTFFQSLVHKEPNNVRAHLGVGFAYAGKDDFDSAISEFKEAAALDPKNASALNALAQAQLQARHFADARDTFNRILALNPNDPRAKAGLAFATSQLQSH